MIEKNKRKTFLLIGLFFICFFVIGVSYAVWQLTLVQTDKNVVTTGCFKIEFTDQNPITLDKAYPVSDEEGKSNTPYEFTLTNTCDSEATYYINLETITSAEKKLSEEYLKASLRKGEKEVFINNLNSSYLNLDKVLSEASNAYKIYQGKLKAKEVTMFYLNLWLDEDAEAVDEVMNATYEGKVTVATSYKAPSEIENMMIPMDIKSWYETTIYTDVVLNNTYTQNEKYGVKEVCFQSEINPYENAVEVVDFSMAQDRSVLGYYVKEASDYLYTLYIQADGKIKTNYDASYYGMLTNYVGMDDSERLIVSGLENLDTSMTTNMSHMFEGCNNTSLDLSGFDTSNVTNMSYMFWDMSNLTNLDLSSFDTGKVTNMGSMFRNTNKLESLSISNFNTSNVTDMYGMFLGMSSLSTIDLSHFDTTNVKDMGFIFSGMSSLTSLDLSHFDTTNVTNMRSMFLGMSSLTSLDLRPLNTTNVTNMSNMFSGMSSLTSLDVTPLVTTNVTDMSNMFSGMSSLTSLDITPLVTTNVTDMDSMFSDMSSLISLDLSHFNTSNVVNMWHMFNGAKKLTNITYGENFIHKENASVGEMYKNCPANKPTHESWNGVSFE